MFPVIEPGREIPRIIHQCYFQGWEALLPEVRTEIEKMKARNPNWDYRFYDAAAAEAFILQTYGADMLRLYLTIDAEYYAARADLFRYLLCYHTGGVYLDCKSTALLPLDEVLRPDDVFLLAQWPERRDSYMKKGNLAELSHIFGGDFLQWFIVSAPGHPFLRVVLERVIRGVERYKVFQNGVGRVAVFRLTGPIVYTLAIHPIRTLHPYRYVKSDLDLHFVYSIFNDYKHHRSVFGTHYSLLVRPLIRRDAVTTAVAIAWFGHLQPFLARVRGSVLKRLRSAT